MKKMTINIKKMFHVLSVINKASKPYLILIIIKTVISSFLPFVAIIYSNKIIDGLISKYDLDQILTYVFWLVVINLIAAITIKILNYYQDYHSMKLSYNLDNLIASKTFELDYGQIESNDTMKLIQKAEEGSNSSGGIVSYGNFIISNILTAILSIIYAIGLLFGLFISNNSTSSSPLVKFINNPLSGLIILFVLIFISIANLIIMNKSNDRSYKAMMGNIDGNRKFGYFYNVCSNYKFGKDIRIFNMQPMIIEAMSSEKYSVDGVWRDYSFYEIKCQTLMGFLSKFLAFIAYTYVGIKAIYKMISIGEVVAYASAITLLSTQLNSFIYTYADMSLRNNYLDNYFSFLNLKPQYSYGNEKISNEDVEIEFKDLSFSYPNQKELILKNINLKINKNKKIAIVGSNGAGKTTLIKLLCRLYEPTSGEILINNKSISEYSKDSFYDLFSIVFQDFKLFSYSIKDNVSCGDGINEDKVWESLGKAGIKDRVLKMDDKLETILYQRNRKNGVEISGGEAQKIAIARALYKDSPIVILDEPTAALDPKSEAEIYEKFNDLVENKTSIFISHRMSSCKFCDEIIVIDNGEVAEKGTHKELLTNTNGIYYKMWNAQAQYYN